MYLCAAKVKANKFTHKYEKKHLRLSFTSGGAKTITHTVKTPNGGTLTASATIHVLPAGVGEPLGLTETQNYILYIAAGDHHNGTKILLNGTIFILRGDKVYTATGQEVK